MNHRKRLFAIITVVLTGLLISGLMSGCSSETTASSSSTTTPSSTSTSTPTTPSTTASASGSVVFAVADTAVDMSSVSKAELTVNSVEAHAQGGVWASVSSQSHVYDIMQLRADGSARLLAQADLDAGSYDMIRLNVSGMKVTDSSGSHQCVLPSSTLEMNGAFQILANATAAVKSDFMLDQSLFVASDGQYVFAPRVQLETRNDCSVQVQSNNQVQISGGQVVTNVQMGMNVDGQMGMGMGIDAGSVINIDGSGHITIGGMGGGSMMNTTTVTGTLESVDAVAGTITVNTSGGTSLMLKVDSSTTVNAGGAISTLVALATHVGSTVQVEYDASTNTATSITVQ